MCLFLTIAFLGPRVGIFLYWIGWPARWEVAFDSFIVPFLGFLFFPWVTLTWLLVAPTGVAGFDYVLLLLAGLADVATHAGGGRSYSSRRKDSAPAY